MLAPCLRDSVCSLPMPEILIRKILGFKCPSLSVIDRVMSRFSTGDHNLLLTVSLLSVPKYGQIRLGRESHSNSVYRLLPEGFVRLFTQQNSIYVSKFHSVITIVKNILDSLWHNDSHLHCHRTLSISHLKPLSY